MINVLNAQTEHELFGKLIDEHRYDFCKLVYIIFPFGQKGHALEHKRPRKWQMEEWAKMSVHLQNPLTRFKTYRLVISTGNGSGKTAFGAMTEIMMMYSQKLRGRVTSNTKPQLTQIVWPEYDKWFNHARYSNLWFEKLGESIKSRDEHFKEQWRFDMFTWDEANPAAVSGLHNEGHAILYTFEEAPGIPANIFDYARGAFSDANTIKFWLVFGNSDDPDSKFEQLMNDSDWNSRRIDTRTLEDVDKDFVNMVLKDCGGDEDHDDFRIRVRGLPRKSNADSIISREKVVEALARRHDFDIASINIFPSILTVDPAWTGGDYTTIWWHQGHYSKLMYAYKLNKELGEDHRLTYDLLCKLERDLKVDAVWIDQGEGTALKTLANADQKYHWELVSFAQMPNDHVDVKKSEYANMRAQMYFEAGKEMMKAEPVLDFNKDIQLDGTSDTVEDKIIKQFAYTKGDRHKITLKKLCESKKDIKKRIGESPDIADGFVLKFYRTDVQRLDGNEPVDLNEGYGGVVQRSNQAGSKAIVMPESQPDYSQEAYRVG